MKMDTKSAILVVEDDRKDSVGTDSKKDRCGQDPSLWKFENWFLLLKYESYQYDFLNGM